MFLGASHAASQRLPVLPGFALQPDFDQKALVMVGTALALHAIDRRSGARRLQPLLERGFVVAQRLSGAQFERQTFGGFAHHLAADEGPHRLQAAIEKQRAHHSFHGIRKHGALAAQAAALFAAAQTQMLAQANRLGHLRHVLAADQPGANAGQFAFAPLRMQSEQRLGHHQAQHGVAEKFQALIVGTAQIACRRSPAQAGWPASGA